VLIITLEALRLWITREKDFNAADCMLIVYFVLQKIFGRKELKDLIYLFQYIGAFEIG
jgi:hypothetical protein